MDGILMICLTIHKWHVVGSDIKVLDFQIEMDNSCGIDGVHQAVGSTGVKFQCDSHTIG